MTDKRVCGCCGWRGLSGEQLEAKNPFNHDDVLTGCPRCREVNSTLVACDEPGCWNESAIGEPTAAGYRNVCYQHSEFRHARMDEDEVALAQRTVY